mgnify:CR=1 FL=1
MTNSRPSRRQLQQFSEAIREAASQSAQVRPVSELQQLRDAYLASLR